MVRRLMHFVRQFTVGLRNGVFTLRNWFVEWFFVLTTPIRVFRPLVWLSNLFYGVLEILAMFRLVRPREFKSELMGGGWELMGFGRTFVTGVVATVVGFFWLLFWLPWFLARYFYHAPFELWYFLRSRTRRQLTYISVGMTVVVIGAIGVPLYLIVEHRRTSRLSFLQRQVDGYLLYSNDLEKLEDSLVALANWRSTDAEVAHRLEMVRKREAEASEPNLVRFFMRYHMSEGRVDASIREANKLLESSNEDWEARCNLANAYLMRGDVAGARKQIANLPRVENVSTPMVADVALNSAQIFKRIGDEARYEEMVDFVTTRILPRLKEKEMVNEPIPNKWFLINCYYLALAKIDKRRNLLSYWGPLEKAAQSIIDDPNVDARMLVLLGQSGQKTDLRILQLFRDRRMITQEEYLTKTAVLFARQKTLWERVVRLDPKLPGGYVGAAEFLFMVGSPDAAEQIVADGLKACGNVPELVVATAKLLRQTDPQRGLLFLERNVQDEKMTPFMCSILDELAAAAGRPDKAIEACRRAIKLDPKQDWARLREAAHFLKLERPTEAVEALRPIENSLVRYPEGCADYVRALCGCRSYQEVDKFLETVTKANCSLEVLLKTADALQAVGRNADAIRWARRALERDTLNVDALMCVADNTLIQADRGENEWDIEKAREALATYHTVISQQPSKAVADRAVNNIVWLELKALHLPQEAFVSAARLRAIENNVETKAEYLETLGAVYLGVRQFDQARKVLIQAVQTSGPGANSYTLLALAYHGLDEPSQADWYLSKAADMKMSSREKADFREAARLVHSK
jgi:tetratricopeptide (TPR) repeat protein